MGIRGLSRFLDRISIAHSASHSQKPPTSLENLNKLVIDGNGFAMYVAELCFNEGYTRNDGAYNYEDYTHRIGLIDSGYRG